MAPPFACERLGAFVAASRWDDLPRPLRHEGKRSLLNFIGCAIGVAPVPMRFVHPRLAIYTIGAGFQFAL